MKLFPAPYNALLSKLTDTHDAVCIPGKTVPESRALTTENQCICRVWCLVLTKPCLENVPICFLFQIFFNYLIPDHDPKAFNPPSVHQNGAADEWVTLLFEGFRRWDAVYFLHIAEYGYPYENTLAFFPLFPMIVSLVANTLLYPLQYILNYRSVLLVSATFINFICFIQAAKLLYLLSLHVLGDKTLAFRAAQLFCINPASIFFSAAYSETLFALITFCGMLQLECGNASKASLSFGISGLCRSNGLVNAGFVLYRAFKEFATHVTDLSKLSARDSVYSQAVATFGKTCASTMLRLALCLLPFLGYQYFAYFTFCNLNATSKDLKPHILSYGNEKQYKMAHAGLSPWCFDSVPLSYTYVQQNHWDVGFFRYYERKQIPNFLLAAPMVSICLVAVVHYLRRNFVFFMSLGLHHPAVDTYKKTEEMADVSQHRDHGFYSQRCYVYLVHMLFLVMSGCLLMHVQVCVYDCIQANHKPKLSTQIGWVFYTVFVTYLMTFLCLSPSQVITRFIASSCPVIYWFIAHITTPEDQFRPLVTSVAEEESVAASSASDTQSAAGKDEAGSRNEAAADDLLDWDSSGIFKPAILVYFHLYMFVGTAAFSNSLPWTWQARHDVKSMEVYSGHTLWAFPLHHICTRSYHVCTWYELVHAWNLIMYIIIIIISSFIKHKNYRIKLFLCALQLRKNTVT